MINEIRDYFKAQIRSVDSDLRFDGFIFNNESISTNNIDKAYKLVIGTTTPRLIDVAIEAVTNVDVLIYKISGTNREHDFNEIYCKALAIYSKIVNQENINQDDFIKTIQSQGISPEAIDSDDNSVRMRLSFLVTTFFITEE